jgi:superfamily II DNA or RNA helicase
MTSVLNLPGQPRMLDVVRAGLEWAHHAQFAISFTRCSGLGLLVEPLREAVQRNARVQVLTSTYQCVTQPEALSALLRLDGVESWLQDGPTGFHAKFWMFDAGTRAEAWAGSSNLSKGGLASNLEWNLVTTDTTTLTTTRHQFGQLLARPDVRRLTPELVERYALRYDAQPEQRLPLLADAPAALGLKVPNSAQREALEQLRASRARGLKRAAVIAATGVGKTYLAAFDAQQMNAKSVLFVSHRKEHLTQARRTFDSILTGELEFHTVQSLRNRPELLTRRWDVLVIDEFHHVEAASYEPLRKIRDNGHTFVLGLTATPERQDGRDVLAWCDWNIAYEVRLPEAIERKWLLPFHYFAVADQTIDFIKLNWKQGVTEAHEKELSIPERVKLIRDNALQYGFDGPKRATVGFCAGLIHAEYMATEFQRLGEHAIFLRGSDSIEQREAAYRRLGDPADPLEWLFVADLLNEGVDIPAINSLLFLRPTESPTIFLQQLGRGLRLTPGCEVLTVLDFVGHHDRAWLALQAIHGVNNTGPQVRIGNEVVRPPAGCEVVLQRRTIEMLAKIRRHTSRREWCSDTYREVREELGRAPLPVDFWGREGAPSPSDFRSAFTDWLGCQAAHDDLPDWAMKLGEREPARKFLAAVEGDWQAQRVTPYAVIWGLSGGATSLDAAYERFFEAFPQWERERSPEAIESALGTFEKKLPGLVTRSGISAAVSKAIPKNELRCQVEGRILPTINRAWEERHGGVLRTPEDLQLHKRYRRAEIIRHFGVHFDPAKHNKGVTRFGQHVVLIFKLDTSGAIARHQYSNAITSERRVKWASQNEMRRDNEAGKRITEHVQRGSSIHLFVQERSHVEAIYLGLGTCVGVRGDAPMSVDFELGTAVPPSLDPGKPGK